MRPAAFGVVVALVCSGPAQAEPACRGVVPQPSGHPSAQFATAELALAVAGRVVSLWPLGTAKLNPEAGVAVTFAGGATCFSIFPATGGDGIRLDADAPVAVVEASVCDSAGGICIPVRIAVTP
jgi:hypothetical protein